MGPSCRVDAYLFALTLVFWGSPSTAKDPLHPEPTARSSYQAAHPGAVPETGTNTLRVAPSTATRFDGIYLNPYLALDLGLTSSAYQIPESVANTVSYWLVHPAPSAFDGRDSIRLRRDGRVVYAGYAATHSYFAPEASPVLERVVQKGDFPNGEFGSHRDGQMDATEALREMVYGEILHRQGVYTIRTLLGAQIHGARRLTPEASVAGVELQVGGKPRFVDGKAPPYFNLLGTQAPQWTNPLLVSGLEHVPAARRARLVATLNEGILKDLWALHGSQTAENRGEAVVDLGTFAFLTEPNPHANVTGGITPYGDEIRYSMETPDGLFLDSFVFRQLERIGLPDSAIFDRYFTKTTEHFPTGDLVYYRAKPVALELAHAILDLDGLTDFAPQSPFNADTTGNTQTPYRVAFNTRKLLRNLATDPKAYYAKDGLTDSEIHRLLQESLSPVFHGESPLEGRLSHIRESRYQDVRTLQKALHAASDYLTAHRTEVAARAYPIVQDLPARDTVQRKAEAWLSHPSEFASEFPQYVESFDPPREHDRLKTYYRQAPSGSGSDPASESLFHALLQSEATSCNGAFGGVAGPL